MNNMEKTPNKVSPKDFNLAVVICTDCGIAVSIVARSSADLEFAVNKIAPNLGFRPELIQRVRIMDPEKQ